MPLHLQVLLLQPQHRESPPPVSSCSLYTEVRGTHRGPHGGGLLQATYVLWARIWAPLKKTAYAQLFYLICGISVPLSVRPSLFLCEILCVSWLGCPIRILLENYFRGYLAAEPSFAWCFLLKIQIYFRLLLAGAHIAKGRMIPSLLKNDKLQRK